MRIIRAGLLVLLFCFPFSLLAQQKGLGVGAMAGSPTGVSAKYWLDSSMALSAAAGYSFLGDRGLAFNLDILFHTFNLNSFKGFDSKRLPLILFYGYGLKLGAGSKYSSGFGFRGVLGMEWPFRKLKIDTFIEVVPVFTLLPETGIEFDFGIGARYYFPELEITD